MPFDLTITWITGETEVMSITYAQHTHDGTLLRIVQNDNVIFIPMRHIRMYTIPQDREF
jgi:hypothetical protein